MNIAKIEGVADKPSATLCHRWYEGSLGYTLIA